MISEANVFLVILQNTWEKGRLKQRHFQFSVKENNNFEENRKEYHKKEYHVFINICGNSHIVNMHPCSPEKKTGLEKASKKQALTKPVVLSFNWMK